MNKIINKINKTGLYYFTNLLSSRKVLEIKNKLNKVYNIRKSKKKFVGGADNQILWSYFYEDKSLLNLVAIPKIDRLLRKLLDEDYVLQSSVAQNRLLVDERKKFKVGSTWHTDSRYLGGQRLDKNFSYLVIIALDDFTKDNGATYYIEGSLNLKNIPKRNIKQKDLNSKKLKIKRLIMKAGTVCVMNTGIWHKAGESSLNSRWSIFSIYTGWFVKPYFKYDNFYKLKIKKNLKKLLHFNSQTPKINEIRPTLVKLKK
mgnify:CR=1 FL=1|jgi:ectoine hydroxylase-related dioxygenase (phytanoyl-CoA dioxygenase family)